MSKVEITRSKLDDLADTIAEKAKVATPLTIAQMDAAVASIPDNNEFIVNLLPTGDPVGVDFWTPDCTLAEIQAAYNSGKTITTYAYDDVLHVVVPSDGSYNDEYGKFDYSVVYEYAFHHRVDGPSYRRWFFWLDADGTHSGAYDDLYNPARTLSINLNGNYDVKKYASVAVNVPSYLQAKTNIAPTTTSQTITADSGFDGLSSVQINAMPTGTAGTPTATKGTVSNHSVSVTPSVTNTTGYITGGTKTGTAVSVSASELVSGTYTVDSSGTKDVTNYASASVPSGTTGTPSASKGTVSNHSVSITPSVTNTTGWITGGTKTGTAVTVTASELASGNKAIVDNGTNIDVVGYSTVSVAVPFSTIYTGTTDPSSSQGVNGDIYIKTS